MSEADSSVTVEYRILEHLPAYRVGDDGTVWTRKNGRWGYKNTWRQMRLNRMPNGYLAVNLASGGKRLAQYVHRLVLGAFVGPCPEGMMCAHNNGDPADNRLQNLRWDTVANNQRDKIQHGTIMVGERHPNCKLRRTDAERVWSLWKSGENAKEIGRLLGVSDGIIRCVLHGITWKELVPALGPATGHLGAGRHKPLPASRTHEKVSESAKKGWITRKARSRRVSVDARPA